MGSKNRDVTVRRNLQQVKHCVEEALSVVENGEDRECALDDLQQAMLLIDVCMNRLKRE